MRPLRIDSDFKQNSARNRAVGSVRDVALNNVVFTNCTFDDAWNNVRVGYCQFRNCTFDGTMFNFSVIHNTRFVKCTFIRSCALHSSTRYSVEFENCVFIGGCDGILDANLTRCSYKIDEDADYQFGISAVWTNRFGTVIKTYAPEHPYVVFPRGLWFAKVLEDFIVDEKFHIMDRISMLVAVIEDRLDKFYLDTDKLDQDGMKEFYRVIERLPYEVLERGLPDTRFYYPCKLQLSLKEGGRTLSVVSVYQHVCRTGDVDHNQQ